MNTPQDHSGGLARRSVTPFEVLAQSVANIAPSAVIAFTFSFSCVKDFIVYTSAFGIAQLKAVKLKATLGITDLLLMTKDLFQIRSVSGFTLSRFTGCIL